jgi:hypothetical protein
MVSLMAVCSAFAKSIIPPVRYKAEYIGSTMARMP